MAFLYMIVVGTMAAIAIGSDGTRSVTDYIYFVAMPIAVVPGIVAARLRTRAANEALLVLRGLLGSGLGSGWRIRVIGSDSA
jgi:hypothetical protein